MPTQSELAIYQSKTTRQLKLAATLDRIETSILCYSYYFINTLTMRYRSKGDFELKILVGPPHHNKPQFPGKW